MKIIPIMPEHISANQQEVFKSCKQKWMFRYVFRLIKQMDAENGESKSIHLNAGAAFALAMDTAKKAFYGDGSSASEALQKGREALIDYYLDNGVVIESADDAKKSVEKMLDAYTAYFREFPLGVDQATPLIIEGKPAHEWKFEIPLPITHPTSGNPMIFLGILDSVLGYMGQVWVSDEKTTVYLSKDPQGKYQFRGQFIGYVWALTQLLPDLPRRKLGGVLLREVGTGSGGQVQKVPLLMNDTMIATWYENLLGDLELMKSLFERASNGEVIISRCQAFDGACFGYNRPCYYAGICSSDNPLEHLLINFVQKTEEN